MARFRVKEIAEAQGMTTADLHRRTLFLTPASKISYQTVRSLWRNETQRPSLDTLDAVARALGVNPGDLIGRNDEDGRDVDPGTSHGQDDESEDGGDTVRDTLAGNGNKRVPDAVPSETRF